MMLFRSLFSRKSIETPQLKKDDAIVNGAIDMDVSSIDMSYSDGVTTTPRNSIDSQDGIPDISRQSSEGMESNWEVKLDPKGMTVDCSCGFSMFRRFRNKG